MRVKFKENWLGYQKGCSIDIQNKYLLDNLIMRDVVEIEGGESPSSPKIIRRVEKDKMIRSASDK